MPCGAVENVVCIVLIPGLRRIVIRSNGLSAAFPCRVCFGFGGFAVAVVAFAPRHTVPGFGRFWSALDIDASTGPGLRPQRFYLLSAAALGGLCGLQWLERSHRLQVSASVWSVYCDRAATGWRIRLLRFPESLSVTADDLRHDTPAW